MTVTIKENPGSPPIELRQFFSESSTLHSLENLIPLILGDLLLKTAYYQGRQSKWQIQVPEDFEPRNPSQREALLENYHIGLPASLHTPQFHQLPQDLIPQIITQWKKQNLIQSASTPLPWSTKLKRPLSSHEIIYQKQIQQAYYLKIPLQYSRQDTASPWGTLPSFLLVYGKQAYTLIDINAYAIHPDRTYVAAEIMEEVWIFAESQFEFLRKHLNFQEDRLVERFPGSQLLDCQARHPLQEGWIPLIATPQLRLKEGTGSYPFTPAHIPQEYEIARQKNIKIPYHWESNGQLAQNTRWPSWVGKSREEIQIEIFKELGKQNLLLKSEEEQNTFPLCQASQTPVLYRPIPGQFLDLKAQDIAGKIQDAFRRIHWIPEGLSLPIPPRLKENTQLRLSQEIEGSEKWEPWLQEIIFNDPASLPSPGKLWLSFNLKKEQRQWFFSQLIAELTQNPPTFPERVFLNAPVVKPKEDLSLSPEGLRIWVASHAIGQSYRLTSTNKNMAETLSLKLRHTLKKLTQLLTGFSPERDWLPHARRAATDQYALLRLSESLELAWQGYQNFSLHRVLQNLAHFCRFLRKYHFTWCRDSITFDSFDSEEHRSAQSSLWEISQKLFPYLAPFLPHTTEQFWQQIPKKSQGSLSLWQQEWQLPSLDPKVLPLKIPFVQILWVSRGVERAVAKTIEAKRYKNPLQTQVKLAANPEDGEFQKFLQKHLLHWPQWLGVSQVVVAYEIEKPTLVWKEKKNEEKQSRELAIEIIPAEGKPCARCGRYSKTVGKNTAHLELCERCGKMKMSQQ